MRLVSGLAVFFVLTGCGTREPFLRPDSVKIVEMLGKPSKLEVSPPCEAPQKVTDVYLSAVGKDLQEPLAEAAPTFALAASKICPASRPVIYTEKQVEFPQIAPLLGGQPFAGDGRMQMEPWLWIRILNGKAVGLEFQLDQI